MGQAPPRKDAKYLEDLLRKRLDFVKHLNADLQCNKGVLAQTVASYSEILDGEGSSCHQRINIMLLLHTHVRFVAISHVVIWPVCVLQRSSLI